MTNLSHGDLEADAKDYAIGVLIEELRDGVTPLGIHDDNSTELFDVEGANEKMLEAADALAAAHATIHQLGENAAKAAGEYAEEVGRLREALQTVVDALRKHHQWHAAQTDPDPEHGFIPANEYADSSLYDATVDAFWVAQKATGPHDFAARAALTEPTEGADNAEG